MSDPDRVSTIERVVLGLAALGALVLAIGLASGERSRSPSAVVSESSFVSGSVEAEAPASRPADRSWRLDLSSVTSATEWRRIEGGWVILDGRDRRLHALGPGGRVHWSTPGPGDGPGELRRPMMVVAVGERVVVVEGLRPRFHYYDAGGSFLRVIEPVGTRCAGGSPIASAEDRDDAFVLFRCLRPNGLFFHLVQVEPNGVRWTDFEHQAPLEDPRALVGAPMVAVADAGLLWGTPFSRCLDLHQADGTVQRADLCHPNEIGLPIGDAERQEFEESVGQRRPERLPDLPGRYPPFGRAVSTDVGWIFEEMRTGGTFAYYLVDGSVREPLEIEARFPAFIGRSSILVAEDRMEGVELRLYRLEDR